MESIFVWTFTDVMRAGYIGLIVLVIVLGVLWALFDHFIRRPYRRWQHARKQQRRNTTL